MHWSHDHELAPGDRVLAVGNHGTLTATRSEVHDLLELAEERTTLLVQHLGVDQWKKVEPDAHRDDQRTYNHQKTKVGMTSPDNY